MMLAREHATSAGTNPRLVLCCFLATLLVAGCAPGPRVVASPSVVAPTSPSPTITQPSPVSSTPTAAPPTPSPGDTRFGAVFFGTELNATDLPCSDLEEMGVRSTFFGAWWGQIEPQPGQYDWASVDGPVDAALACGVEPLLKVVASPGPGIDSTPPEDMDAYARFVFELARHLKGRVGSYAIENEVNNGRREWTGETYGQLRSAAYTAIKSADPEARVLDGGLTMQAYLAARASELAQAGKPQDAIAMLQRFEAGMTRTQKNLPSTEQELSQWLGTSVSQRGLGLVEEMRKHPDSFDAVQLHYLQDAWVLLPEYAGWIEAWFPGKPFEFWEIGYGWPSEEAGQPFSEEGHAAGVVMTLVSALGEGARRVIYEPYWEEIRSGAGEQAARKFGRGLVTPDGARLAAAAYATMATQLRGLEEAGKVDLGADVWAYRFKLPQGETYVVWARDSTTVSLPMPAGEASVTDIYGNSTTADPAAVPVQASPVFVRAP